MKVLKEQKKELVDMDLSELMSSLKQARKDYQLYLIDVDLKKEKNVSRKDFFRKKIALIKMLIKEKTDEGRKEG
jgi:ribosomal protein L29